MAAQKQYEVEQLFTLHGTVDELEIPVDFLEHIAERAVYDKHDVSATEVLEAHKTAPQYFINEGEGRRAPIAMVGPTRAGRMLCVPIEPTGRAGLWRCVSAYEANAHHIARYKEGESNG